MTQEELNEVIRKHELWLNGEEGGVRACLASKVLCRLYMRGADMRGADMRRADMRGANMRDANMRGADMSDADMRDANMRGADMRDANMRGADMRGANMRDANMRGADIDYACLPLWCGSLTAHFDDRQLRQIAYHLVKAGLNSKNASEETKNELAKLIDFANGFHRVEECGKIERKDVTNNGNV